MLTLVFIAALAAQGDPAGDPPPPPAPASEAELAPGVSEPAPIEPRDDAAADNDAGEADHGDDRDADGADDGEGGEADREGDDEEGPHDNGITVGRAHEDEPGLLSQSELTLGGRLGASAGNPVLEPFYLPGAGAFLIGSQRLLAFDLFYVGADGGLALGDTGRGALSAIAGYRGRVSAGLAVPFDIVTLESELHAGLTSVALLPVPRMGLGGALKLALPVTDFMTLDAEGHLDLDFLVIVPAPAASLEGGATFWLGDSFFTRVHAGVGGDGVLAIIANSASASVFVAITAGVDLDLAPRDWLDGP